MPCKTNNLSIIRIYDVCRAKRICQKALLITKEENVMSELLKSIAIVSVVSAPSDEPNVHVGLAWY